MIRARYVGSAIVLMALLAVVVGAAPVLAGHIAGAVFTPFGLGLPRDADCGCTPHDRCVCDNDSAYSLGMSISVNQYGSLLSFGHGDTFELQHPKGDYDITPLDPSYNSDTYAYGMLFHERDIWPRSLMYGVRVPNMAPPNDVAVVKRQIQYQNYCGNNDGDVGATDWCQSFMATGTSLVQVGIHEAIEFGPDVRITIHEGNGPNGTQIGPERWVPTKVVNPSSVYWSHGEVPLVPGQTYTVKFHTADFANHPMVPFFGTCRVQGGVNYPEGQSWHDGIPGYHPIKMVLCQDDDGIITCVSTKKTNFGDLLLSSVSVTTLGQTFTAHGSSLLSLSLLVGNTGGTLQAFVYSSPGTNGQGSGMVGVAKGIKTEDWNNRSGCVWKPGEVPLQEGQQYYIKVLRPDGQPFTVYYVDQNEYAGGQLYVNGIAQADADLSTTICTEEYPGSLDKPTVQISDINVVRGTTTATISWTTDASTTTDYVRYATATPYQSTLDATHGTSHSATLTGLAPNTLYHYRVVSKVSGYRDAFSRDFVFVTDPDTTNLLSDPGFELGSSGPWVVYTKQGHADYHNVPDYFGCKPHSGTWIVGDAVNGSSPCYGGAYQRVPVTSGFLLKLRSWVWTWQRTEVGAMRGFTVRARCGIDPTGGTDPNSPSIVWSNMTIAQDLFGDGAGIWTECATGTMATSDYATVFVEGGADETIFWTVWGIDDVALTQYVVQPVDCPSISDVVSQPNGTFVELGAADPKVVVATPLQTQDIMQGGVPGPLYVEESDRSAGLRVECNDSFSPGDRVVLRGTKMTRPSGEPYLAATIVSSKSSGAELGSLGTLAKNIGVGIPSNVAMLMRTCGLIGIVPGTPVSFYINDGSMVSPGLKIDVNSLYIFPDLDQMYGITGIVELDDSGRPMIRPRGDFTDDVQKFTP